MSVIQKYLSYCFFLIMATHSYMCMCTKIGDLSKLHRSNVKTGLAEMKGEKRFRSEMVRARSSDFLATGAERANELIRGAKSRPVLSAIDARAHAILTQPVGLSRFQSAIGRIASAN